jgi:uncharacterized membrane protein
MIVLGLILLIFKPTRRAGWAVLVIGIAVFLANLAIAIFTR